MSVNLNKKTEYAYIFNSLISSKNSSSEMMIFVVSYKLVEFLEAEKTLGRLSQFEDMKSEKDPGIRSDCRTHL